MKAVPNARSSHRDWALYYLDKAERAPSQDVVTTLMAASQTHAILATMDRPGPSTWSARGWINDRHECACAYPELEHTCKACRNGDHAWCAGEVPCVPGRGVVRCVCDRRAHTKPELPF